MSDNAEMPLTIVIFGATGDLARKKLLPALMDLYVGGYLPAQFSIIGFSRSERTHEEFRSYMRDIIAQRHHEHRREQVDDLLAHTFYCPGDMTVRGAYSRLAHVLAERDEAMGGCSNKLYYLSVPPDLYGEIFEHIAGSGMGDVCVHEGHTSWVRIAVEKPFGRDLETAHALDRKLASLFAEEQIFRIDHYLAKQAIENILAFRFSNILFEPTWCAAYIESVHISFCEDFGVGTRGAFYEGVGALRDVGQNHMLQMLALTAMEDPGTLDAASIRKAREETIGALTPFSKKDMTDKTVKGQYRSYRQEKNVASDSMIETYFRVEAQIDNDRWRGVPFILEGGKMLDEHRIEIRIQFKPVDSCASVLPHPSESLTNELSITMHPQEQISIRLWAKKPGFSMELAPRYFKFPFDGRDDARKHDAYEKLLLDCIRGDQTLFTSSREVENAWRFITPIVEAWEGREPIVYEDNSRGPVAQT